MKQIITQDVTGWYGKLNGILTKHGLSAITVPDISGPARAAQVTPLTDRLESMKTDTYYKLATYSDWGQVVKGAVMREQTPLGLEATLSSIEATIVCRNMAGNSYGTCSNGVNSNGSDSNGICSNGVCSNGSNSDGTCPKGTKTNGACSNGTCSNGSKSNGTRSNGTNSYGSYSDGTRFPPTFISQNRCCTQPR